MKEFRRKDVGWFAFEQNLGRLELAAGFEENTNANPVKVFHIAFLFWSAYFGIPQIQYHRKTLFAVKWFEIEVYQLPENPDCGVVVDFSEKPYIFSIDFLYWSIALSCNF